ncbi:MAG: hypothetical protein Fur005_40310 [Roseiflexaceae bacterium]
MTIMLEEENDRLRAENAELRALVAQLQEQLAAAFVRIAELEQERRDPPPFVKPSKPARAEPKPPRKKRAARHNQARQREQPTRTIDHALDRCPDCHYQLCGQAVVKRILDGQFRGHLVSDFYGGSNQYAGQHQRCWVHLLRDVHALKEAHAQDSAVQTWVQELRATDDDAKTWLGAYAQAPPEKREAEYVALTSRSHALGLHYTREKGHACQALAKRLLRHEDELFQFVLVPGLSADHNLAERAIRPLVVIRKISGRSRSAAGTKTRMALASLFHTWHARGLNPFEQCLALLSQSAATPTVETRLPQV